MSDDHYCSDHGDYCGVCGYCLSCFIKHRESIRCWACRPTESDYAQYWYCELCGVKKYNPIKPCTSPYCQPKFNGKSVGMKF